MADNPESAARYDFVHGEFGDTALVGTLMPGVDEEVNFAAETHVNRLILEPGGFTETNVRGT